MIQLQESRSGWPRPWMVALAALTLFWIGWGDWLPNPLTGHSIPFPILLAGLNIVAAVALVWGGLIGRVVAATIALAGAVLAIALALVTFVWAVTDPHGTTFSLTDETLVGYPTWIYIAIVVAIVAGYGLVLVRAIRGR
jgi:hypothetical protein